ncbi:MAG: hypothetical protein LiPW15_801 [Parcubacteria group bacterium LiPW_15]|jgi:Tfp pilus assembly protein PilO|nr:MAG: hypothetical protein LiPW15_801 [Parcubacteria group bacterium LiPW_15]
MEKSFRKDVIVGICIIVGTITLFFVGSALFSGAISELSTNIAASKVFLLRRAELISNLADIKKSSQEVSLYAQKMNSLLPMQEQLLNLPQALQSSASAHAVTFSFSFRGVPILPQTNAAGIAAFSLDSSGKLENLLLFLNDIEPKATRYIISIDTFDLSQVGEGNYHLVLQGRAFFQ